MSILVNIGGVWRDNCAPQNNIGGVWETTSSVDCNIGGTQRNIYTPSPTEIYLYKAGNLCTSVTGGWGTNRANRPYTYGTITNYSTYMKCATSYAGGSLDIQTMSTINITPWSYLNVEVSGYFPTSDYDGSEGTTKFGVTTTNTYNVQGTWTRSSSFKAIRVLPTGTQSRRIYSLSLASCTGYYYFKMCIPSNSKNNYANIYNIWLS